MPISAKPAGVQGLNNSHPLYPNIRQFFEFGQTNSELVSSSPFTHGGVVQDDPTLGSCIAFNEVSTGISMDATVSSGNTVLLVYQHAGLSSAEGSNGEFRFLNLVSGDTVRFRYTPFATHNYEFSLRSDFGSTITFDYKPFEYGDAAGYFDPHAFAHTVNPVDATLGSIAAFDGVVQSQIGTETSPAAAFSTVDLSVPIANVVASADAATKIAAVVIFNSVLSTAELESVTSDPWAMLSTGPAISLANNPKLGAVLSGTGTDYAAEPTGPISITQGARSLPDMPITVSAWDAGTGSFNWTTNAALPGLPANGADTTPFVLTGEDVTITLPDPGA